MKIRGSKVLVTGSNRGIGRAFVDALLARGAGTVYAGARDPSTLLSVHPGESRVERLRLDITDADSVDAAVASVGPIDILINNAGSLASYSVLQASREQLEHDLAVNFFGTLAMSKAFAPALESSQGGIVNMLTLVSLSSMAGIGGYAASKAAAWSMSQALRAELGQRGIKVFAAYPGAVDTDMIRSFEMDKTPPIEVANNILDAVERDQLDCFPDPMSRQAGEAWLKDPRALERMFASM